MYICHALINTLRAHMIHINYYPKYDILYIYTWYILIITLNIYILIITLNMIFYIYIHDTY